ncbi:hypothetical protein KKE45_02855 [Patescibacteria group bacterium]|nr:hypothetical protein [Patescibacteria group bacterium]
MHTATYSISDTRKNFSKIVNDVFLGNKTYLVSKRGIPLIKISKINSLGIHLTSSFKKTLDLSLFGIFKKSKKTTQVITKELREKAWKFTN